MIGLMGEDMMVYGLKENNMDMEGMYNKMGQ